MKEPQTTPAGESLLGNSDCISVERRNVREDWLIKDDMNDGSDKSKVQDQGDTTEGIVQEGISAQMKYRVLRVLLDYVQKLHFEEPFFFNKS